MGEIPLEDPILATGENKGSVVPLTIAHLKEIVGEKATAFRVAGGEAPVPVPEPHMVKADPAYQRVIAPPTPVAVKDGVPMFVVRTKHLRGSTPVWWCPFCDRSNQEHMACQCGATL